MMKSPGTKAIKSVDDLPDSNNPGTAPVSRDAQEIV